ncbi:MAG: hypothetical protein A2041_08835 [Bacteroidetes bacterium GWA2_31_9b]|nr:MAG: hypothetical protein A2041_08835 [Bacteroidetes bacterium GWA2_31_9b]
MNSSDLIKYINNPDLLNNESISEIRKILSDYPYFQTAHKLILKNLKLVDSDLFQNQLNSSAIHISDRVLLYNYLQNDIAKKPIQYQETKESEKKTVVIEEEKAVESEKKKIKIDETEKEKSSKLIKNHNVRRKIKDGIDGMGDNISATISSQINFVETSNKQELEYPKEIYFIEEERIAKSKKDLKIAADSSESSEVNKDLLFIDDENNGAKLGETNLKVSSNNDDYQSDLIEIDENIKEKNQEVEKTKQNQGFDISDYAEKDDLLINSDENDLISKFILKNPRIQPADLDEYQILDISEKSAHEDENLLTETLAKVYIAQGYFEKAIHSYEKLCLKYPEKNTYFASQIEMIKELINKQKNT